MRKKLLIVAMQMSIHTARWISHIDTDEFEVFLFPVNSMPVEPSLRHDLTLYQPVRFCSLKRWLIQKFRLSSLFNLPPDETQLQKQQKIKYIYPVYVPGFVVRVVNRYFTVSLCEPDAKIGFFYSAFFLKKLIKTLKPDLVHSLEFQHCSYNVLHAKNKSLTFPRWLATNWGSDIYYFRTIPSHFDRITQVLGKADYYSCECHRDVELAREMGFNGEVMPVFPNTGGINLNQAKNLRFLTSPSKRHYIMIKGYQHFAGRAMTALDVIVTCYHALKDYTIICYSCSEEVEKRIHQIRQNTGLNIQALKHIEHSAMLEYFSKARIYIGLSISDAISTSLLESMAMGCFPIQTNTSCCEEWIEDGVTGFSVSLTRLDELRSLFLRALTDDVLVDKASELNWMTVKKRLDSELIGHKINIMYKHIMKTSSSE